MNNSVDDFGDVLRQERENRGFTQKQLAEHMGISYRTILQAETHKSNPRFETVSMLARELNISLDALIFPESVAPNAVSKCVFDFFRGKSEAEAKRLISICMNIEELYKARS